MKNLKQSRLLAGFASLLIISTFPVQAKTVAERLGWVEQPVTPQNVCGGYYQEEELPDGGGPVLPFDQMPVNITFEEATFRQEGASSLTGDVTLLQPQRVLSSERADLYRNAETAQFTEVDLYGNVKSREPGKLILGDTAHMNLLTKAGSFRNALYRLSLDPTFLQPVLLDRPQDRKITLTAQGQAEEIHQTKRGFIDLYQATYSTCPPGNNDWRWKARKIALNREEGRGVARDAVLTVKDVPVFYTPYLSFPLDKRRKSGILFPSFGIRGTGGLYFLVPYYWNIAPNYDATISPAVYTKRGLQINTEFRYLTEKSFGTILASFLPNDRAFAQFQKTQPAVSLAAHPNDPYYQAGRNQLINGGNNRYSLAWKNKTQWSPNWSSTVNYSRVSDDYYFRDFVNAPTVALQNQLLQQGDLLYTGQNMMFRGLLQQYQTLHPITQAPVSEQYRKLPQLSYSMAYPGQRFGLNYQLNTDYVHFTRRLDPGQSSASAPPQGDRFYFQPGVSLPLTSISGYIIPSLQFQMTSYQLSNQPIGYNNYITRALPIVSVDSGLYFDRDLTINKQPFQQTLEPRLFYLYVPYRDQYQIPIFDTSLQPFNYDQIFRTNRFSGFDRIGDANQVTMAVTTRFIDQDTGQEKLKASIGAISYFQNRRVNLCTIPNGSPACLNGQQFTTGYISPTASMSPIVAQATYNFNPKWSLTGNVSWNPPGDMQNGDMSIRYQPLPDRIISVGYRYLKNGDKLSSLNGQPILPGNPLNNLSQTTIAGSWPIRHQWRVVGSWNYNISHRHSQTYFYGLEYNSCCWATRLVIARTFTGLNNANTPLFSQAVYFQVQLKGFGNLGTNDPRAVLGLVPGYRDQFSNTTYGS